MWVSLVEVRDGEKVFRIVPGQPAASDDPYAGGYFDVELVAPGLRACRRVFVYGWTDLGAFFGELAAGWRGWSGTKSWTSPEHDLRVDATFGATGHVALRLTVQDGPWASWHTRLDVSVDAGEDMAGVARAVAAVLST